MAMLRAYVVKATYNWLVDHGFTPYILVDTEYEGVVVPNNYIDEDNKILLDLSPQAIQNSDIGDNHISFDATFDGEPISINIPIESVLEVFSKETEQGMYAREFGYGININEGEDDETVNPKKIGEANSGNVLSLD
ncbi:ClpXP protease specificity-enhancing factor [Francisella noatunensis]|uniref:ClpXP protease specificity-enhancing factor n=1 Tax=Francisella noatunensis TaxID=657445 RepID=A0A9Q2KXF2_9GAMM|nr:ClpXP protease specificity-enhancing factor [Francisella noatunensis]MBK2028432.1 ClpXP protease specificity-enhancing factor [Francisella noatunensis]MBK2033853.1 ClpXP protease specificity-enhancing factor [Francisella noatunensis]MBK2049357.1 ClpXP protease specificity-enhancing factor [Francisella noatunensis]MBK2050798.1 ClpXP protease specificity-enhancing factor [Francisella noatunensis]MBK2052074.1 ClpXP protease specificity-enhancing factor [Francisella noatunensis]